MFSDIDILVPENRLDEVESALMISGFSLMPHSPYDDHYYRAWMHELPPMQHRLRGTLLDVHHHILPRTARCVVPIRALFEQRQNSRIPKVQVLAPHDLVLHSACHWFFESEYPNGLRDALDIRALIEEFATEQSFWQSLASRADALGLTQALAASLWVCQHLLGLDVPWEHHPSLARAKPEKGLLPGLYLASLIPNHPLTSSPGLRLAHALLYLRGHALRMPAGRLALHLARKALIPDRLTPAMRRTGK
jgi:hypothetical protein